MQSLKDAARALVFAALVAPAAGAAEWKPQRSIEIIVPTSPGSGLDAMARTMELILRERKLVERPASVINKTGGGQNVALSYLAQKAGDPHVLFMIVASVLAGHITGQSQYNYTDFTPIAMLATEPIVFVVRAESPLKSGQDLISHLKADPASVSIAFSTTRGNTAHVAAVLAGRSAGADIRKLKAVVYNSAGDGIAAALGGHVDVVVGTPANIVPLMQAGKVRMLAITSAQRLGGPFAGVPTWKEQGVDAEITQWRGVMAPKGLAPEQVAYWESVLTQMTKSEDWRRYLETNQFPDAFTGSAGMQQRLKAEYDTLREVLGSLGMAK